MMLCISYFIKAAGLNNGKNLPNNGKNLGPNNGENFFIGQNGKLVFLPNAVCNFVCNFLKNKEINYPEIDTGDQKRSIIINKNSKQNLEQNQQNSDKLEYQQEQYQQEQYKKYTLSCGNTLAKRQKPNLEDPNILMISEPNYPQINVIHQKKEESKKKESKKEDSFK